jgi:hypothetical protein
MNSLTIPNNPSAKDIQSTKIGSPINVSDTSKPGNLLVAS